MSEAIVAKIGAVVLIRKFVRRLILTDVDPALRRACGVLLIERDDFETRILALRVALGDIDVNQENEWCALRAGEAILQDTKARGG